MLENKKMEHKLKEEEEQTENRQQVKRDDIRKTEKQVAKRTNKKKITLGKNDERERNIGETKPQNITEDGEKDMHGL